MTQTKAPVKTEVLFDVPVKKLVFKLHDRIFHAHGLKQPELKTMRKFQNFNFGEDETRVREALEPVATFLNGRKTGGKPITPEWLLNEFTILELAQIAAELSKLPSEGQPGSSI